MSVSDLQEKKKLKLEDLKDPDDEPRPKILSVKKVASAPKEAPITKEEPKIKKKTVVIAEKKEEKKEITSDDEDEKKGAEYVQEGGLLLKIEKPSDKKEIKKARNDHKDDCEKILKLADEFRKKYGEYFEGLPSLELCYEEMMKQAYHKYSASSSYDKYLDFYREHLKPGTIVKEYNIRLKKILMDDIVKSDGDSSSH